MVAREGSMALLFICDRPQRTRELSPEWNAGTARAPHQLRYEGSMYRVICDYF
jgi:hypothetical protein